MSSPILSSQLSFVARALVDYSHPPPGPVLRLQGWTPL